MAASVALGLVEAVCIALFSWLVASAISEAFLLHAEPGDLVQTLGALAAVVLVRTALSWASAQLSAVAAARVKAELRSSIVEAYRTMPIGSLEASSSARLTVIAGRGLDALDGYFGAFVPQLVLTAIATPLLVLVLASTDLTSGIILFVTLPLIPVFMVLIGWFTQGVQRSQWQALSRLSTHFLDVVEGLPTLKIFGRQWHQIGVIRGVTDDYRVRTMRVLRVSFLSGFVLELAATLSVALVAVSIGTRLISGDLGLTAGLFVLLLTPECFLPIRSVGSSYHAATEGIEAANDVFEILDAAVAERGKVARGGPSDKNRSVDTPDGPVLRIDDLSVSYEGAAEDAIHGFRLRADAGEIVGIRGRSGAGKSTVFAALLGFAPAVGTAFAGGHSIDLGEGSIRAEVAWAGQSPALRQGTIAENVALGAAAPDGQLIRECLRLAAADTLDPDRLLDVHGAGVSGGQAQRIALARAYYRLLDQKLEVLLLDEPTSALDESRELRVIEGWRTIVKTTGACILVISHRPRVLAAATSCVEIEAGVAV